MEAGPTASKEEQVLKFKEQKMVWEQVSETVQVEEQTMPKKWLLLVEQVEQEWVWEVRKASQKPESEPWLSGVSLSEKQAKRAARGAANKEL
jgi:hypothetical protein